MRGAEGILGILFFFILFGTAHGATIAGTAYDGLTLEAAPNAVITITTNPVQTKLTKDGTYQFTVQPGNYLLRAAYSEKGIILLETSQPVKVTAEGNYTIDLILLPDIGNVPDEPLPEEPPKNILEQIASAPESFLLILLFAAIIAGYSIYHVRKKTRITKEEILPEKNQKDEGEKKSEELEIDKYAVEILQILKRGGNRITQKEMRGMVNIGEAKVSLVVSELEEYELLKKIKRGRGNILILTEKGRKHLENRKEEKENNSISNAGENESLSPKEPAS